MLVTSLQEKMLCCHGDSELPKGSDRLLERRSWFLLRVFFSATKFSCCPSIPLCCVPSIPLCCVPNIPLCCIPSILPYCVLFQSWDGFQCGQVLPTFPGQWSVETSQNFLVICFSLSYFNLKICHLNEKKKISPWLIQDMFNWIM